MPPTRPRPARTRGLPFLFALGLRPVQYIRKGEDIHTEHYSAIAAEVPDPGDPSTQRNTVLVDALRRSDRVIVAGEAGSHCVASTVRDLADPTAGDSVAPHRIVLRRDAVSPGVGFEAFQEDFLRDLTARDMILATTTDF